MQYMPSVAFQAVSLLYSAGLGFTLGIIYDLFRMLFYLLTGNDKKFLVIRDIIYSLLCLSATFLFLLVICNGKLLLYVFLGEAAGLTIYFYSLSDFVFLPVKRRIKRIRCNFVKFKNFSNKIRGRILSFKEKINKNLHKTRFFSQKDLHIRHNIVYNLSVKLYPCRLIFKKRGDESGRSEEK